LIVLPAGWRRNDLPTSTMTTQKRKATQPKTAMKKAMKKAMKAK
jgi:hypothetical protein